MESKFATELIVIPESMNFVGAYGIRPRLDAGLHRHDGKMTDDSFDTLITRHQPSNSVNSEVSLGAQKFHAQLLLVSRVRKSR